MTMSKLSLPVARLVRENISVLMTYAFSKAPLQNLVEKTFAGDWKQFHETVFLLSEQRAEKACLELAIFLRYLDDDEDLNRYYDRATFQFGRLEFQDGSTEELKLREVANKIIHAAGFEWDLSQPFKPKLVCISRETEKWIRARVDVVAVSAVCGSFIE